MTEVEAMITHFATLTARRDDSLNRLSRQFSGITTGPVILIVGRLDPTDLELIATVPHHSTLPILLAVAPVGAALDRAADVGWHVGTIDPEADLAFVWGSAVGRGLSHALG